MFKVMILICHMSLAPADCQLGLSYEEGLLQVIAGPDAPSEIACGMHGQAYYAETALGASHPKDAYVKVLCRRTTIGKADVG